MSQDTNRVQIKASDIRLFQHSTDYRLNIMLIIMLLHMNSLVRVYREVVKNQQQVL